ncbi:hypothetical protein TPMD04_9 [Thiohalocapsa phage LS06-2018-MD04]|jgi:hypothetical protein|nr:hypothetical protein TPMD04_9 [Thiohalocapsa phage LS06-2018-MD04]
MQTMTAKELRDFLFQFPDDMPVAATWEGVVAPILPGNFEPRNAKWERLEKREKGDRVVVNVEDYSPFVG